MDVYLKGICIMYCGCRSSIYASGACSLSEENCLFDGCRDKPCISIDEAEKMNLKLIANTFRNLHANSLPIGKEYGGLTAVNDQAIIKNNKIDTISPSGTDILRVFLDRC